MCYCPTPTLHLNLALTGDGALLLSLKKTYSVWFISVLNYGDTENVLINHLLLVIPMPYPCHYTNLCPHKPHKHAHTHTHTHTHDSLKGLVETIRFFFCDGSTFFFSRDVRLHTLTIIITIHHMLASFHASNPKADPNPKHIVSSLHVV